MTPMAVTVDLRALRVTLASLLTLLAVSACSGNDTPAVCSDVDALKTSVSALTDVKVEQGALSELQSKLTAVQQDLAKLKTDAKSEFSTQLDGVDTSAEAFKSSLEAAVANPTATTLSAVVPPLQSFGTALTDLESAVDKTC